MKWAKLNGGFTLIELLIGLNLAFILITLLVSFYLFSARFVSLTSRNMDAKEILLSSVGKLQELIKKRDGLTIKRGINQEILFIFPARDTVLLKRDSFRLSGLYPEIKIDDCSLRIFTTGKKELALSARPESAEEIPEEGYTSKDIESVLLKVIMKGHEYTFRIVVGRTSENSFEDIEK